MSLAARLDRASALQVREAVAGDRLDAGTALVAPGGRHLHLLADHPTTLGVEPPIGELRPRADLTIADVARVFGRDVLLVVLTGMGKDGLEGAIEVRRNGGRILVEAESSCTVYGMPRAIVEAGLADGVYDLGRLPGRSNGSWRHECHARPPLRHTTRQPVRPGAPGTGPRRWRGPDDYVCSAKGRDLASLDLLQYKRGQMERRLRSFSRRLGIRR